VRLIFASIVFDAATEPKQFSAGFGLAAYAGEVDDFDADGLMAQADIALCVAKQAGPNQVGAYWQLDPDSLPKIPVQKRRSRSRTRHLTQRAFIGVPKAEARKTRTSGPESSTPGEVGTPTTPSGEEP
jgi:hypothetical protein